MDCLAQCTAGRLTVSDGLGVRPFGAPGTEGLTAEIHVLDHRFYRLVVLGGSLGAAEAYIRGYWDTSDLTTALRVLVRNSSVLAGLDQTGVWLLGLVRRVGHWLRRNTRAGSRRNIAAHYDLSNDFFALMLDASMTYSSGIFPSAAATLEEASIEKYDRICRKLEISPRDHVLEIGTGWGGFAEHAARHYGCRVTTTTISEQQYAYAADRFRQGSLQDRITLLRDDYRELGGRYDKLVSIEMIEAVGEKYLPHYFAACSQLLKSDGAMMLQAITIPDDRYEGYRKSVDFIQQYIFPGGFLPSMGAIGKCLQRQTDFRVQQVEPLAAHYARTLACWRRNFWEHIETVKSLGFDDRFIRTWHYYLCYCEAGFRERQINVSQLLLAKSRD